MVRGVGLMALCSHLRAAVAFGPSAAGAITYATHLWASLANTLPRDPACSRRHESSRLIRAQRDLRWRELRRLGPRDALVELDVSREARKQDPSLPERWVDPWPDPSRGPAGAVGIFLASNLVRLEMERGAGEGVDPTRIRFVAALRPVCDEWLWCALASPGAIPKHLRNLRASLETLILPRAPRWTPVPESREDQDEHLRAQAPQGPDRIRPSRLSDWHWR